MKVSCKTFNVPLKVCNESFNLPLKVCMQTFNQTCKAIESLTANFHQKFQSHVHFLGFFLTETISPRKKNDWNTMACLESRLKTISAPIQKEFPSLTVPPPTCPFFHGRGISEEGSKGDLDQVALQKSQ